VDQLLSQFGSSVQGVLDSAAVQFALRAAAVYLVLLWLGAAFWAFRDASHRSHNLLAPYAAGALVVLATPVFFPFALLLYMIVRPGETLVEAWERRMAEEAAAEAIPLCAGCGRRTDPEWLACPACGNVLRHRCGACARLMALDWNVCAWCGNEPAAGGNELAPRRPVPNVSRPSPAPPNRSGHGAVGADDGVAAFHPSRVPLD
jgi:predicted RNA-binding Zn-ribbon protein involved in translation (DUF1610 family)